MAVDTKQKMRTVPLCDNFNLAAFKPWPNCSTVSLTSQIPQYFIIVMEV